MELLADNASLLAWRESAGPAVFVPTMGALHEGHAQLVRRGVALARASRLASAGCVVSIFVNPTQFNDPSDLARYPRTLEADLATCRAAGAAAVYAPSPADIYPPGQDIPVPPLPDVATRPALEDAHRPGHFAGVCQVVLRLFTLVRPAAAVFGEKDWQQLQVITAMTARERLGIEIIPEPTVREPDGLAMSSRNRFLSEHDRERALSLSRALKAAAAELSPAAAETAMRRVLDQAGVDTEYAVVRDAGTLLSVGRDTPASTGSLSPPAYRALIAARVGSVRLIDNAPWPG
ncbi:MAG: Pantothenate synthetase [Phycisphaerales bacterium]|nr:Pantothenate synthetase [Phycisphaerales bacterium]